MGVRSDRLVGPLVVAAGATATLFTVPSGETWLVKRACATNEGAATGKAFWVLTVGATSGALYSPSITAATADDHETWWALDAGASLKFIAPALLVMTVSAFGAKLQGVA